MRTIYLRIDDIFNWKRGWSMVYLNGNEAACMANRLSINVVSRPAGLAVYSRLSEDEIAEFLTETERKENKNTQNILLDICYLLFEKYPQERPCVYILKLCRKMGQSLEEISLQGGKSLWITLKYFEWIIKQLLNSRDFRMMWRIVLCRSRWITSSSIWLWILTLYSTQPHSIIAK